MSAEILRIEYRSGVLLRTMVPEHLAALTWSGQEIPKPVRQAIHREKLLELGGTYGQETAMVERTFTCPIVYRVFEELRAELAFKLRRGRP